MYYNLLNSTIFASLCPTENCLPNVKLIRQVKCFAAPASIHKQTAVWSSFLCKYVQVDVVDTLTAFVLSTAVGLVLESVEEVMALFCFYA